MEGIIAVIVEGGIVQGIVTDNEDMVGMEFMVIDYDTDGATEQTIPIHQCDDKNTYADAYVGIDTINQSEIDLEALHTFVTALENNEE